MLCSQRTQPSRGLDPVNSPAPTVKADISSKLALVADAEPQVVASTPGSAPAVDAPSPSNPGVVSSPAASPPAPSPSSSSPAPASAPSRPAAAALSDVAVLRFLFEALHGRPARPMTTTAKALVSALREARTGAVLPTMGSVEKAIKEYAEKSVVRAPAGATESQYKSMKGGNASVWAVTAAGWTAAGVAPPPPLHARTDLPGVEAAVAAHVEDPAPPSPAVVPPSDVPLDPRCEALEALMNTLATQLQPQMKQQLGPLADADTTRHAVQEFKAWWAEHAGEVVTAAATDTGVSGGPSWLEPFTHALALLSAGSNASLTTLTAGVVAQLLDGHACPSPEACPCNATLTAAVSARLRVVMVRRALGARVAPPTGVTVHEHVNVTSLYTWECSDLETRCTALGVTPAAAKEAVKALKEAGQGVHTVARRIAAAHALREALLGGARGKSAEVFKAQVDTLTAKLDDATRKAEEEAAKAVKRATEEAAKAAKKAEDAAARAAAKAEKEAEKLKTKTCGSARLTAFFTVVAAPPAPVAAAMEMPTLHEDVVILQQPAHAQSAHVHVRGVASALAWPDSTLPHGRAAAMTQALRTAAEARYATAAACDALDAACGFGGHAVASTAATPVDINSEEWIAWRDRGRSLRKDVQSARSAARADAREQVLSMLRAQSAVSAATATARVIDLSTEDADVVVHTPAYACALAGCGKGMTRFKYISIDADAPRPAYFGTWSATRAAARRAAAPPSSEPEPEEPVELYIDVSNRRALNSRNPFGVDKRLFDYDVDSEAEWEATPGDEEGDDVCMESDSDSSQCDPDGRDANVYHADEWLCADEDAEGAVARARAAAEAGPGVIDLEVGDAPRAPPARDAAADAHTRARAVLYDPGACYSASFFAGAGAIRVAEREETIASAATAYAGARHDAERSRAARARAWVAELTVMAVQPLSETRVALTPAAVAVINESAAAPAKAATGANPRVKRLVPAELIPLAVSIAHGSALSMDKMKLLWRERAPAEWVRARSTQAVAGTQEEAVSAAEGTALSQPAAATLEAGKEVTNGVSGKQLTVLMDTLTYRGKWTPPGAAAAPAPAPAPPAEVATASTESGDASAATAAKHVRVVESVPLFDYVCGVMMSEGTQAPAPAFTKTRYFVSVDAAAAQGVAVTPSLEVQAAAQTVCDYMERYNLSTIPALESTSAPPSTGKRQRAASSSGVAAVKKPRASTKVASAVVAASASTEGSMSRFLAQTLAEIASPAAAADPVHADVVPMEEVQPVAAAVTDAPAAAVVTAGAQDVIMLDE